MHHTRQKPVYARKKAVHLLRISTQVEKYKKRKLSKENRIKIMPGQIYLP